MTLDLGALLMFLLSSACAMLTRNAKGVDWMELNSGGLKSAQWVIALFKPPPGPYLAWAATTLAAAAADDCGVAGSDLDFRKSGTCEKNMPAFQRARMRLFCSSCEIGSHASPDIVLSDVQRD